MTLFSAPNDLWSHRTRIVLAEKGIGIDIISVAPGRLPGDLLALNPYHSLPTRGGVQNPAPLSVPRVFHGRRDGCPGAVAPVALRGRARLGADHQIRQPC